MKKILTLSIIAVLSISSYAQLKVGIQAGRSHEGITILPNTNALISIQPGVVLDYAINKNLSIKPSINYLQTGMVNNYKLAGTTTIDKAVIHNIRIPVDFTVGIKIGSGKLLASLGPTFNFGIDGKITTTVNGVNTYTNNLLFKNQPGYLKKISWGAQLGLGYAINNKLEFRGLFVIPFTNELNNPYGIKGYLDTNGFSILGGYYFLRTHKK